MTTKRTRKILDGEELFFYGYKEPLRKYEEGFGYMGVLAHNKNGDKVQCHICGEFYSTITTTHINKHGFESLKDYKKEVGLALDTALVSEKTREKLIMVFKDIIEPKKIDLHKNKAFEKVRIERLVNSNKNRTGTAISLETKNLRGNCPDQLLEKLQTLSKEIGKTPTKKDFRRKFKGKFMETIYRTFGTWSNAVRKAGMIPIKEQNGGFKYSDKQLLDYLREFYKINKRVPTHSDFSRGLLPDREVYRKRFKTLNKARVLANIPVLIQITANRWVEYKPTKKEKLNFISM